MSRSLKYSMELNGYCKLLIHLAICVFCLFAIQGRNVPVLPFGMSHFHLFSLARISQLLHHMPRPRSPYASHLVLWAHLSQRQLLKKAFLLWLKSLKESVAKQRRQLKRELSAVNVRNRAVSR